MFLDSGNIISDEIFCTQNQYRNIFFLTLCTECLIRKYLKHVFVYTMSIDIYSVSDALIFAFTKSVYRTW